MIYGRRRSRRGWGCDHWVYTKGEICMGKELMEVRKRRERHRGNTQELGRGARNVSFVKKGRKNGWTNIWVKRI